jgi:pimeloyl-ACP methyl ester carboxylesterase
VECRDLAVVRRALLVVLLATACRTSAPSPSAPEGEGVARTDDGVEIAYEDRGPREGGADGLVLLHDWACDREFWREQIGAFGKDRRVVAIEFAGHGKSGANRRSWSVVGLAEDVRAVVVKLDLRRVVLVGHSMGGVVALEAARRMPDRVIAVVGVDALHDAEFVLPKAMLDTLSAGLEKEFETTVAAMVVASMLPSLDPQVGAGPVSASRITKIPEAQVRLAKWVIDRRLRVDHSAAIGLMRSYENLDLRELFRGAGVPIRCVNAAPRDGARPTETERNRKYADFDAVLVEGAGHFLMLEKPAEFDARLREVLEKLRPPSGADPTLSPAHR